MLAEIATPDDEKRYFEALVSVEKIVSGEGTAMLALADLSTQQRVQKTVSGCLCGAASFCGGYHEMFLARADRH